MGRELNLTRLPRDRRRLTGPRDGVAKDLPYDNECILDWAHTGRMMRRVDRAIAPLAYGRLTDGGSAFELWDLFVRFRHYVWIGRTVVWQQVAARLARLFDLREKRDPVVRREVRSATYSLLNVVTYLNSTIESLIDYRTWQRAEGRISSGFVESSISRIVGHRMCKSQHIRWSPVGAHSVVKLRVALLTRNFTRSHNASFRVLDFGMLLGLGDEHPGFLTVSSNSISERSLVGVCAAEICR